MDDTKACDTVLFVLCNCNNYYTGRRPRMEVEGGEGVCEVCNLYISKIYIQYSSIRELKQYNKSLPYL